MKSNIWKYTTALVVMFIIINPETVELALFIDAVGLEVFLMLLEIQFVVIFGVLFSTKIKAVIQKYRSFLLEKPEGSTWTAIMAASPSVVFAVPIQAILMYMLILLTAAIGIAQNFIS